MVFENIPVRPETKRMVDAESKNKESYDEIIKRVFADRSRCTCVTSQGESSGGAGLSEKDGKDGVGE